MFSLVEEIFYRLGLTQDQTKHLIAVFLDYLVLFDAKQADYGSGNIGRFGEFGVLVRAYDKVERLAHLHETGAEARNESKEDSWLDLMGYGAIGLMLRRGTWGVPYPVPEVGPRPGEVMHLDDGETTPLFTIEQVKIIRDSEMRAEAVREESKA